MIEVLEQYGLRGVFHKGQNLGIESRHPGARGVGGMAQWVGSVLGVLRAGLYFRAVSIASAWLGSSVGRAED